MAKIAVLLTPGFADWEYALIGGTGGPFYGLDVKYFAPLAGDVTSQGGLKVRVARGFDAIASWQPEAVVVVGGTIWETDAAPDIGALLLAQHRRGAVVAGICGGTLALARAGLLDSVSHTSNDSDFLGRNARGYAGSTRYQESAAAVSDGGVITAPGTAPVSFTAAIFDAAGVEQAAVQQLRTMMAAEHL